MIASKTVSLLIEKGYKISFAESCTGGMCVSALVDVPNTSEVLKESYITYAEEAKEKILGVKKSTIEKHNVVSSQVASEMAIGVSQVSNANVGVGITGVAGPTGGTEEIPVGTVWIGIAINGNVNTYYNCFKNMNRYDVRKSAVLFVYEKLEELLK